MNSRALLSRPRDVSYFRRVRLRNFERDSRIFSLAVIFHWLTPKACFENSPRKYYFKNVSRKHLKKFL